MLVQHEHLEKEKGHINLVVITKTIDFITQKFMKKSELVEDGKTGK